MALETHNVTAQTMPTSFKETLVFGPGIVALATFLSRGVMTSIYLQLGLERDLRHAFCKTICLKKVVAVVRHTNACFWA